MSDGTERAFARRVCLPRAVRFHDENDEHGCADEDAALDPEFTAEQDQPQDQRLECDESAKTFDEPDLQKPTRLRTRSPIHVTDEKAVSYADINDISIAASMARE